MTDDKAMGKERPAETQLPSSQAPAKTPLVDWKDEDMATSFSNVVNIQSTQEQVDLFFGTNQTWSGNNDGNTVTVELNNRVIMSPHAAKRLWRTLGGVIDRYEETHGMLKID